MKRKLCNSYVIIFLIVLIIGCYAFSKITYQETFMPKIVKETYRPIERKARMLYEGFYNKTLTSISNLFRKFGIL